MNPIPSIQDAGKGVRGRFLTALGMASLAFTVAATLSACSDDTAPDPGASDAESLFEASLDPRSSSFVLSQVSSRPGFEVQLLGSNLSTDATSGTVSLDVAVRNVSERDIAEPAMIWLTRFSPENVAVTNANVVDPTPKDVGDMAERFGFDYAGSFGADQVLSPNEVSASRTWVFSVPDMASFSFSAIAEVAASLEARLGGTVFHDLDEDGSRDTDEPPFFGRIIVTRPDGTQVRAMANEAGGYSVPVYDAGLHLVTFEPPDLDCPCVVAVTTPNPLEVVLVPDGNGTLQDYMRADFGAHIRDLVDAAPIVLTDRLPDEIRQDEYRVLDASLADDVLSLRVEFSGCTPDHDFALFMTGGFMESMPVQARIVLSHDDLGELCDALFQRTLRY
ncbi:MAG: hypothetical protein R3E97_24520, partial [Candidatus Eisenbacteria bacterium]